MPCRREWPGRRELQMVVFAEYVQTSSAMLAVHGAARRHLRYVFRRKTCGQEQLQREQERLKSCLIAKTGQLYRVPRMHAQGTMPAAEPWAAECIT